MKMIFVTLFCFTGLISFAQKIDNGLADAFKKLEADAQFKHAVIALYVTDSKTGKVIFDKNAEAGLVPASCQKIITSVSAFELLGKDFKYKTSLSLDKRGNDSGKDGLIIIYADGDPVLGSSRYVSAQAPVILKKWCTALKELGIKKFNGILRFEDVYEFRERSLPPKGYVWEDIGNYYGANSWLINWKENQYDIKFKKGEVNGRAEIQAVNPVVPGLCFINNVRVGEAGSGDNAYIFCAPYSDTAYIKGTIPAGKDGFSILGSMPHPALVLGNEFKMAMKENGIDADSCTVVTRGNWPGYDDERFAKDIPEATHYSPPLDSINFWFLKKSINLYGEALLKSLGASAAHSFDTEKGVDAIKNFWSKRAIEPSAINIIDGSGLSPSNRVTAKALVTILQYARQQKWFASFYNALPEINGIKMKDGYMTGVRSYTGYIKNKKGNEYIFSFIVNNYDGNASAVREKMWRLLDLIK